MAQLASPIYCRACILLNSRLNFHMIDAQVLRSVKTVRELSAVTGNQFGIVISQAALRKELQYPYRLTLDAIA